MRLHVDLPPEEFHGGIDRQELKMLGKTAGEVLDLSSNILFVRHPFSVHKALRDTCITEYPDRDCTELRQQLAERHKIEPTRILVGNGCCELVHLLAHSVIGWGDRVFVAWPTFSEYRRASVHAGAEVETTVLDPVLGSSRCLEQLIDRLRKRPARMVWICNPNNPTGAWVDRDALLRLARRFPSTVIAIDESYIAFATETKSLVASDVPNIVVLRSLTKSHALAGLRLGYLVAHQPLVDLLLSRRVPWSVNAAAQAAGVAALSDQAHYDRAMANMALCRARLIDELRQRGLTAYDSDAGFILVRVEDSDSFRSQLLARNVLVRDCGSFGLTNHIRISVGDDGAIDRLLHAVDEIAWVAKSRRSGGT